MPLTGIRSLVLSDIEATDKFICQELASDIPFINQLVEYIVTCGGKRIRPLLVLLSAKAFRYDKQLHVDLAAAIELIHTATLLHDDVVDNSNMRRGRSTVHTIWGSQASVLVGDFLYSRAFQLIVKLQNLEIMSIFSEATNIIAEGEVMQLVNCHQPDLTEAAYFEVIQRKTAKLFEVATRTAATLSSASTQHIAAMQHYGMQIGIAYQLIDDALDYHSSLAEMGKNIGNDLAEGKPTLPIIYALQKGSAAEIAILRDAIKTGSCEKLDTILAIIDSTKAIQYTADAAKNCAQQAMSALTHIPESPFRQGLHDLATFVVERNH